MLLSAKLAEKSAAVEAWYFSNVPPCRDPAVNVIVSLVSPAVTLLMVGASGVLAGVCVPLLATAPLPTLFTVRR